MIWLRRSDRVILTIILFVAAFLRSHYLLQIEHNIDHAYPVWQALDTLEHGTLPLTGQSTSVLFSNPALTGYLYLPLVALTRSPIAPYILVIALNTLAVLLSFRAVRGLLGTVPALIAAALMAVNPWVIEYSRTSWVQSLLPFFTCAVAWLLWPVLTGRTLQPARRTLLALVMLTLLTQTYLLAYLLVIPVGVLIVIFWRRIPKRALLVGGGILLGASLLYGAGLLAQWDVVQQRLNNFGSNPSHLSGEALGHALRLVSGNDYAAARGVDAPADDAALRQSLSQIAHVGATALLVVGVGLAGWRFISGRSSASPLQNRDVTIILLVWFGLPIVLMSYVGQPVHPFYQLLGLPAGYALVAWGMNALFRPQTRLGSALLGFVLLPFALLMGVNSTRYYQETAAFPGAHGTTALSLEYGLKLGQQINEMLPRGRLIYADESPWILSSFAGQTLPVVRYMRAPGVVIVPGLYINAQINEVDQRTLITMPDGYSLGIALQAVAAPTLPLDYQSDQGISLIGYDLTGEVLTTYWRVDAITVETPNWLFGAFAHVFNDAGERVQIIDGEVVPGNLWRVGDVHMHRMTIPNAAPYRVEVGQYDSTHAQNVIFLPDYVPTVCVLGCAL